MLFPPQTQTVSCGLRDDFKLAGPTKSLSEGWQLIRKKVRMEEPTPLGKYLGCGHTVFATTLDLTNTHAVYRWPPDMSNPVVSPRGASSAQDDEGELLAKAAGQPALASVAGQLA